MSTHSFDTKVAEAVGIQAAVVYQHILFWVSKNAAHGDPEKHFREGKWWTYQSARGLSLLFPYLTEHQVRRAIEKLEQVGFIGTGNFNAKPYDRTRWFCVLRQIDLADLPNGSGSDARPIPDRNPDRSTDTPPDPPEGDLFGSQHEGEEEAENEPAPDLAAEFWDAYPKTDRKVGRGKVIDLFKRITAGKVSKIPKTDGGEIVAAVKRYAAENPDPQYIPMPTRWLNEERWNNYPARAQRVDNWRWDEVVR